MSLLFPVRTQYSLKQHTAVACLNIFQLSSESELKQNRAQHARFYGVVKIQCMHVLRVLWGFSEGSLRVRKTHYEPLTEITVHLWAGPLCLQYITHIMTCMSQNYELIPCQLCGHTLSRISTTQNKKHCDHQPAVRRKHTPSPESHLCWTTWRAHCPTTWARYSFE